MTKEEEKLLSIFETRLIDLIHLHDEQKRENARLKQLLKEQQEENMKFLKEYKKLEETYTNFKTAAAINLTGSDAKDAKLRLSKLVREVDKCIALLNE